MNADDPCPLPASCIEVHSKARFTILTDRLLLLDGPAGSGRTLLLRFAAARLGRPLLPSQPGEGAPLPPAGPAMRVGLFTAPDGRPAAPLVRGVRQVHLDHGQRDSGERVPQRHTGVREAAGVQENTIGSFTRPMQSGRNPCGSRTPMILFCAIATSTRSATIGTARTCQPRQPSSPMIASPVPAAAPASSRRRPARRAAAVW